MPAITVSAVNTGTDVLTATAHGLTTGDRLRLRNVGGALPAATPSLVGTTDYFGVRVDADNFKISDTNAHALAGTNIVDLTGSGSGTTTVEYALPYCLPTGSAAQGTQIKSKNDNDAWASLVALYSMFVGRAQAIWTSIVLAIDLITSGTLSGARVKQTGIKTMMYPTTIFVGSGGGSSVTMTSGGNTFAIPGLFVGQRVVAARGYWARPTGGSPSVTMRIQQRATWDAASSIVTSGTADTTAGGTVLGTGSGLISSQTIDITSGKVIEMEISVSGGTGLGSIFGFEIDVTEP